MESIQVNPKKDKRMIVRFLFQHFLMVMAALMVSMAFIACDEPDDNGGGDDGGGNGNGGGGSTVVTGKRIKTIVHSSTEGPVRFEYSYNSDGTTKQIDAYEASSKLVMRDMITCNPDGTWATLEQTDLAYAGTVLVLNHSYDGNKKPLKIEGTLSLEGVVIGSVTFDFTFQNGRKISQKQVVTTMGILAQELQSEFMYDANGRRTKTIITPAIGATVEYTRTYNTDGTVQRVNVSGTSPYTMDFTWENGNSTVNMDDIWGW